MQTWIVAVISLMVLMGWGPVFPAHAEDLPNGENSWLELELRGWAPALRGNVQSSSSVLAGTNVSLSDTLGMDTTRQFYWPKATLHFAENHRFFVSYLDMRFTGDKTLTQNVVFNGTVYPVATPVHSEIKFKEIVGGYQYDWLKSSWFASNLNLQVHYLDIKTELNAPGVGSAKESFKVPIPTIGGGVQFWPVSWLKLHGDFNVFKLGVPGFKGELLDGQGALTVSPWEWVGVSLGYRYYRLIAHDTESNDHADWLQHGPYLGITARF